MDAKSQQMETQLQLLKKEQSAAEDFLQDLQRQQNEQEWLAEDFARVHQEERSRWSFCAKFGKAQNQEVSATIWQIYRKKKNRSGIKKSKRTKKNTNKKSPLAKKTSTN